MLDQSVLSVFVRNASWVKCQSKSARTGLVSLLSLDEFDECGAEGGGGVSAAVGGRGRRRGDVEGREAVVEVLVDWVGGVVRGAFVRLSAQYGRWPE